MKIIAYDTFKPGVTLDDLRPYLRDEVSNVWRLWMAGLIEWQYIAMDAPLPLEFLFDPAVDVAQPWNRTPPA